MGALGLKKGTVKLVQHQPSWHKSFHDIKAELENLIGAYALDIQHIGSTFIEGVIAKPILDIGVKIRDKKDIIKLIPILENNNFEYRGDGGSEGGHLFVRCSDPDVRTHHVHLIEKRDDQWTNYLFFRDELNGNRALANEYSALKIDLAKMFPDDRRSYTAAKNEFISKVLQRRIREEN